MLNVPWWRWVDAWWQRDRERKKETRLFTRSLCSFVVFQNNILFISFSVTCTNLVITAKLLTSSFTSQTYIKTNVHGKRQWLENSSNVFTYTNVTQKYDILTGSSNTKQSICTARERRRRVRCRNLNFTSEKEDNVKLNVIYTLSQAIEREVEKLHLNLPCVVL